MNKGWFQKGNTIGPRFKKGRIPSNKGKGIDFSGYSNFCFDCKKELGPIKNGQHRKLPRRCMSCSTKNMLSEMWKNHRKQTIEEKKARQKLYIINNKKKIIEWKNKNRDQIREKDRLYRKLNPDKYKLRDRMNRANRGGTRPVSIAVIQKVYEENIKFFGTLTCIYCFKPIEFGKDTLEHKLPLKRGGNNEKENLAVACFRCNSSKGAKTYEEYMELINQPQGGA